MALSELEQAFAENLILLGALRGTRLLYPILRKEIDARPLWDIVGSLQLVSAQALEEAHALAVQALEAAGQQAFSFSEGAMIGTWELTQRRGQAPGGEVWLAQRAGQVATVRLVTPGSGHDPERAKRFIERSNAGLDPPHPAILRIDEAAEDFGWLYTASKGMDCCSLADLRAPGPLPESTAIALAQSLAGSLAVVHELGVVQGGITPLAVLIRDQRIYLSDFAVSAAVLDGPLFGCRPGGRLGVLLYASPGLIAGDAARGLKSQDDLYALGAVVMHAVSAVGPTDQRAQDDAPWVVAPPVSDGLQAVLGRLLSTNVEGRYGDARSLLEDLQRVAEGGLPDPLRTGQPIRGRRSDFAEPQRPIQAHTYQKVSASTESSSDISLAPSDSSLDVAATAGALAPAEDYAPEEAYEGEEPYEPEDAFEPEEPKSFVQPPRARSSRAELVSAPSRRRGGGWLMLFCTIAVLVGGVAGLYGVNRPVGVDLGRTLLGQAEAQLRAPQPNYGLAGDLVRQAIEAGHKNTRFVRSAMLLLDGCERRSAAERASLIPAGSEATREAIQGVRAKLEALAERSKGLSVYSLMEFDLARADKEEKQHVWSNLAAALLAGGHLPEARIAFMKSGSKNGQKLVHTLEAAFAFVRGGPYLVPAQDGEELGLVQRDPCYLARTEVTRAEYTAFLREIGALGTPHKFCELGEPEAKDHDPEGWVPGGREANLPACGVDYYDASAYAKWRGGELADAETLVAAARGPRGLAYPWGDADPGPAFANLRGGLGAAAPVGCFPGGAAESGALDLLGNLAEWTRVESLGAGAPVFGGHFDTPQGEASSAVGEEVPLDERRPTVGFRVMISVKTPEQD